MPARVASICTLIASCTALPVAASGQACPDWDHVPAPTPTGESMLRGIDASASGPAWAVGHKRVQISMFSFDDHPLILRWNGTQWEESAVPHPSPYGAGQKEAALWAVERVAAGDVWAVGTYRTSGADGFPGFQTLAMHHDGSQWQQVDTPLTPAGTTGATLKGLDALAPDDVWAAGIRVGGSGAGVETQGLMLRWDGSSWEELPAPPPLSNDRHEFNAVAALAPDDVWAVGSWGASLGMNVYLAHWNGSSWSLVEGLALPPGLDSLEDVTAVAPDDIWAVGRTVPGDGTTRPLILHYDGNSWQYVPFAGFDHPGGWFLSVASAGPDEIWAVGGYSPVPLPAPSKSFIARYDGNAWSQVPAALAEGTDSGEFRSAVTLGPCDAWVAGTRAPGLQPHTQRLTGGAGVEGDVDGSGAVDVNDLVQVILAWGDCPPGPCPADVTGDGTVDVADLVAVLLAWG